MNKRKDPWKRGLPPFPINIWLLCLLTFLLGLTYPIRGIRAKTLISTASITTSSDAQQTAQSSCEVDSTASTTESHQLPPKPLEFSIDFDLPSVSYLSLRREMLSDQSDFWLNTVMTKALHYSDIQRSSWDKYPLDIGQPTSKVDPSDFINATRKQSYRMPKSLLVDSIVAYETATLSEYMNEMFVLQRTTHTPDAPFGKTYIAKTQVVVVKTSEDSCKMMCSVEAEFPNGPPMGMGWPIRKGMRDGTLDGFKIIAKAIQDYL